MLTYTMVYDSNIKKSNMYLKRLLIIDTFVITPKGKIVQFVKDTLKITDSALSWCQINFCNARKYYFHNEIQT